LEAERIRNRRELDADFLEADVFKRLTGACLKLREQRRKGTEPAGPVIGARMIGFDQAKVIA
jgi:hypothetical protein